MPACKRFSAVIEKEPPPPPSPSSMPPEKTSGWFAGKIRRPFFETLKRTDQACRRSWFCCGKRDDDPEECLDATARKAAAEPDAVTDTVTDAVTAPDRPRWRGQAALLAACVFCISGSCLMWTTNAFDTFVANQMILDESKGSFDWWVNPPINPWFKVYIWNYTNWDDYVQNPDIKIKLQEVGPFTYREEIKREGIKFDEKGITLAYREVKKYTFVPELSGESADLNATVLVPNLPFFGAKAKLNLLWGPISMGLNLWGHKPLVAVKANDFIWGYKDELFDLSKLTANVPMDRVGLMTSRLPDDMVILTGTSDIDKLSYFVRYNEKERLNAWPDPACNTFEGTDGSMFPPRLVHAKQPVFAYKAEACRQIKFVFKEKSYAQGVRAHRYIIDRGTFNTSRKHPENRCFCNPADLDECPPDGLFDTSPCSFGAPTLISYPHFFLTDPKALEPFEGLEPDAEKHDMFADVHPRLGMTLMGRSRLQLNLRVTKDLPHLRKGLVLPVAWFAQDMPPYEGDFKTMLVVASYGLDALEFLLLYILPVVAIVTGAFALRRLLLVRGARRPGRPGRPGLCRWPARRAAQYRVEGAELADRAGRAADPDAEAHADDDEADAEAPSS